MRLVHERDRQISLAQEIIRKANRDFDREAKRIGTEINMLEAAEQPTPKHNSQARQRRELNTAGLNDEEIRHYHELLRKTNSHASR